MTWLTRFFFFMLLMPLAPISGYSQTQSDLLDLTLETISPLGEVDLKGAYAGQVILVVNTASACGFTPQYDSLQKLYEKYRNQGFVILGFPSNDFFQELQSDENIASFCRINYGVNFPLFKKSSVKGDNANPFYQKLIKYYGQAPEWNFYKYLINQDQEIVGFYSSKEEPLGGDLEEKIRALLVNSKSNNS